MAFTFDASNNLNVTGTVTSTPSGTQNENLTQVGGSAVSLGAKTSANSIPVVLATDEATLPVLGGATAIQSATWNSSTANFTSLIVPCSGYGSVGVEFICDAGTFSAGTIHFYQRAAGNTGAIRAVGMRVVANSGQLYDANDTFTPATGISAVYYFNVAGLDNFIIELDAVITGTGNVTITTRAVAQPCSGPTTVGQSDATKLNATVTGTVTTNAGTGNFNENLAQVAGATVSTAASGIQKVGVTGATGTVLDGTTAGVLDENIKNVGGSVVVTVASGVQKVGIVGSTGVTLDSTAGILDTNLKNVGGSAVTLGAKASVSSIPVVLATDEAALTVAQATAANLNATTIGAAGSIVTATWNNTTAQFASITIPCVGMGSVGIQLVCDSGTFTQGTVHFYGRATSSGSIFALGMRVVGAASQQYDATSTFTPVTSQQSVYWFNAAGLDNILVELDTVILGTGNLTITARAYAGSCPGPTTVGQSDATKHNVTDNAIYNSSAPAPSAGATLAQQADSAGSLFVKPYRRSQTTAKATTISNSSSATTVLAAQASGVFADISNLVITVTPAATTDLAFTATLSDGTNSFIYDMDTGALATATADPTIININFGPPLPATTAATAWTVTLSVATVTVHITVVAVLQKAS